MIVILTRAESATFLLQQQLTAAGMNIFVMTPEQTVPSQILSESEAAQEVPPETLWSAIRQLHATGHAIHTIITDCMTTSVDRSTLLALAEDLHAQQVLSIMHEESGLSSAADCARSARTGCRLNTIVVRHAPYAATENESGHMAEIARLACYLVSDEAKHIAGVVIPVVRGRYLQ